MTTKNSNIGGQQVLNGLTTFQSNFGPEQTIERLEADIKEQGMQIFARINHAILAAQVGQILRPTEVLIFGNPRAGTQLMQANQTVGIDLPLKALVWEDEAGKTWLTYNETKWLAKRHGIGIQANSAIDMMALTIDAITRKATKAT